MNISFDKTSNVSAVITINIEKADYEAKVTKKLKDITKVAQMPGFRKGHVPAGLVKRMHGAQVKYEEVNRTLNDSLFNYRKEEGKREGDQITWEKEGAWIRQLYLQTLGWE